MDIKKELRVKVGPSWKGVYNASVEYKKGDVVEVEAYVCVSRKNGNMNNDLSDREWWQIIIDKQRIKDATDKAEALNAAMEEYLSVGGTSEGERVKNESSRVENEEARVNNENARILAEGQRVAQHNAAMTESQEATEMAKEVGEHPIYVGDDYFVYSYDYSTHSYTKTSIYVKGEGFSISGTYPSVAAMEADSANTVNGRFYIVASNTDDEDNGKLFLKDDGVMKFIVDLSGMRGFSGKTPILTIGSVSAGKNMSNASATIAIASVNENGDPVYRLNLTLPRIAYSNLTEEQIAELQKPATDKAAEVESRMNDIERNAIVQLAEQNAKFNTAQNNRENTFNTSENNRQGTFAANEQERQQTAAAQRLAEKQQVDSAVESANAAALAAESAAREAREAAENIDEANVATKDELTALDLKVGELGDFLTNEEIDDIFLGGLKIVDGVLVGNGELEGDTYTISGLNVEDGIAII